MLHRTCVKILALSPRLAMVSQSLRDCSELQFVSVEHEISSCIHALPCWTGELNIFDPEIVQCSALGC